MSWLSTRTDGELVALVADGDRRARAMLVDRTLLPASRVAMYLEEDTDRAVDALVGAYSGVFRRLPDLGDGDRFLNALLARLDASAPFPLDPDTVAPLHRQDRERVRAAVLSPPRRGARTLPLVAALLGVVLLAVGVAVLDGPERGPGPGRATVGGDVDPTPDPGGEGPATDDRGRSDDPLAPADEPAPAQPRTDPPRTDDPVEPATGPAQLAETR